MSTERNKIFVGSTDVQTIEKIVKENKTIFTSFEDFVREAIGVYINWWNNPAQSEIQFVALLPHMKPEMIQSLTTIMSPDEFTGLMMGIPEKRKELVELDFYPLSDKGPQRFSPTPLQLPKIQKIILDEKTNIKIGTIQEFFDYALDYFITLWTKPIEAYNKIYEMWPYMPAKTKSYWQKHPKFKETFKNITENAEKYNQTMDSNNLIFDETDSNKNSLLENPIITSTIKTVGERDVESPPKRKQIDSVPSENNTTISNNILEKIQNETLEEYAQISNQYNTTCDVLPSIKKLSSVSKIALPDDNYPLISSFYSRFLPIKIAVTVLGHLMAENGETTVSYNEFREKAYDVAYAISTKIRHHEVRYHIKRHEKRSTGLPYAPVSSTILESDLKEFQKIETSKSRFQEHFIGMTKESWTNRQKKSEKLSSNGLAYFDGALNAMGLVNVIVTKNKELPKLNDETNKFEFQETGSFDFKIGLTKKGVSFCCYKNKIFDENIQSFHKVIFSNNESEFIFKDILENIDLEDKLVNSIIKTIKHNSKLGILTRTKKPENKNSSNYIPTPGEKYLDESIDLEFEKWAQSNKNTKFQDIIQIANPLNMTDDSLVEIKAKKKRVSIRAAIMGRLTELNQITWDIEAKTSNTLYGLVKNKK